MFSLSSLISFVIYLVIGALVVIALLAIFRKLGRQEQAASPQAQWEKAVAAYGDETIAKLYRNATSDQERAEIIAFINQEMNQTGNAPEEAAVELPADTDDDAMGVTTVIPDFQRIALEDMAMEEQPQEFQPEEPAPEEAVSCASIDFSEMLIEEEAPEEAVEEAADDIPEIIEEEIIEAEEDIPEEADEEKIIDEDDPAQTGNVNVNTLMSAPAYNFWQEDAINADENEDKSGLCSRCGCKLEPGAAFCVICGAKVGEAAEEEKPVAEEFSFFSAPIAPKEEAPVEEAPASEEELSEEAQEEAPKKFFGLFGRKKEEAPAEETVAEETPVAETPAEEAPAEEAPAEEQAVCPICGAPVEPDCTFCIICGTNLEQAAAEAEPEPVADPEPVAEPEPIAEPEPVEEAAEEDVISLDDILANVKALEARIFAEAEEADKVVKQQTLNE